MFNKYYKSGTTGAMIHKTFRNVIVVYLISSAHNPWWHAFCENRCPLPRLGKWYKLCNICSVPFIQTKNLDIPVLVMSLCDFSLGLRWCEVSSGYVPQTHQPGHWSPHHSVSDGQSFTPGGSGFCSAGQDQGRAVLLWWLWWQKGVWTALVVLACVLM